MYVIRRSEMHAVAVAVNMARARFVPVCTGLDRSELNTDTYCPPGAL